VTAVNVFVCYYLVVVLALESLKERKEECGMTQIHPLGLFD